MIYSHIYAPCLTLYMRSMTRRPSSSTPSWRSGLRSMRTRRRALMSSTESLSLWRSCSRLPAGVWLWAWLVYGCSWLLYVCYMTPLCLLAFVCVCVNCARMKMVLWLYVCCQCLHNRWLNHVWADAYLDPELLLSCLCCFMRVCVTLLHEESMRSQQTCLGGSVTTIYPWRGVASIERKNMMACVWGVKLYYLMLSAWPLRHVERACSCVYIHVLCWPPYVLPSNLCTYDVHTKSHNRKGSDWSRNN